MKRPWKEDDDWVPVGKPDYDENTWYPTGGYYTNYGNYAAKRGNHALNFRGSNDWTKWVSGHQKMNINQNDANLSQPAASLESRGVRAKAQSRKRNIVDGYVRAMKKGAK